MTTKTTSQYKVENNDLFALYQQNKDLKLRNRILELNLGLVKKEASRWLNKCQESYDDLLQVGSMGLIRAVERFDITKGYAFSSFAIPYIRGEIQHYLRDKGHSVRIPRRCLELKSKANKITINLRNKLNRQPTDREIARELGISFPEWQDIKLANQNREPISLDLSTNDQDDKNTLGDLIPDEKYQSFQLAQEDQIRLQNALSQIEEGTRKVLEFVFLKDLTQKETAEQLGVSVVTVSRRLKKGLSSMKSLVTAEDFD
jgi:RNA polymerase sigma-B factor